MASLFLRSRGSARHVARLTHASWAAATAGPRRAFSASAADSGDAPSLATQSLGVIGAGQMGRGIAQVAAVNAKIPVVIVDQSPDALASATGLIEKLLLKAVGRGSMDEEEARAALARITTSTSLEGLAEANVDFVVEAVSEDAQLKRDIFMRLDDILQSASVPLEKAPIMATNTSSISVTRIASATRVPENVIGMHFMNPVPVMKLVEIITGLATSADTLERTLALAARMGKVTTRSKDRPGFIANRLLMPYINEAVVALQEGIGSVADIDTTMKLGTNVPMGPLTLADFIGLDTCLAIMKVLHRELGDSKYRPAPLLQSYVDAGWLGKKVGTGFYEWTDNGPEPNLRVSL